MLRIGDRLKSHGGTAFGGAKESLINQATTGKILGVSASNSAG